MPVEVPVDYFDSENFFDPDQKSPRNDLSSPVREDPSKYPQGFLLFAGIFLNFARP